MSAAVLVISILILFAVLGVYSKLQKDDDTFRGSVLDDPNDGDLFHPAANAPDYYDTLSKPKRGDSAKSQKRLPNGRFAK